ncbi:adenosylcobinamide amidohydrolase [Terasakiella pusilla]|uniref:adenosylcobinamide amidohydrolase n=1 Tax=Terasakiella pusilla TaxID=64973 RepID=UPI003AA8F98D
MSFSFSYAAPWLVAEFETEQRMLSWSITHPGFCENKRVAWLEVRNSDLSPNIDAQEYMQSLLDKNKMRGALGLMTSRHIEHHHFAERTQGFVKAQCLITLGLSNGAHIGFPDHEKSFEKVGTINSLCAVNVPLSDGAMIEASSIATQARTAALMDYNQTHLPQEQAITGTGTDCIVIACPKEASNTMFAGLHTNVGKALGEAVYTASLEACAVWHKTKRSWNTSDKNN